MGEYCDSDKNLKEVASERDENDCWDSVRRALFTWTNLTQNSDLRLESKTCVKVDVCVKRKVETRRERLLLTESSSDSQCMPQSPVDRLGSKAANLICDLDRVGFG